MVHHLLWQHHCFCGDPMGPLAKASHGTLTLWEAGLNLQPTTCEIFKASVVYLGQRISREGIQIDEHKVEAIKNWPIPNMVTELWSFLGFYKLLLSFYIGVCNSHQSSVWSDFWGQCNPQVKESYLDGGDSGSLWYTKGSVHLHPGFGLC